MLQAHRPGCRRSQGPPDSQPVTWKEMSIRSTVVQWYRRTADTKDEERSIKVSSHAILNQITYESKGYARELTRERAVTFPPLHIFTTLQSYFFNAGSRACLSSGKATPHFRPAQSSAGALRLSSQQGSSGFLMPENSEKVWNSSC